MANIAGRVFRILQTDIFSFDQAFQRIDSRASMRTSSLGAVRIAPDSTDDVLKFELGPAIFLVPDRWTNVGALDLYVVVKGRIEVEPSEEKPFVTRRFATKVGYFRREGGTLDHIFGVHYDFESETTSHPYFHAQVSDESDLLADLGDIDGFSLGKNLVQDIFRWVRIPAAQMDFLVLPLQIAADHLLPPDPTPEAARAFRDLRETCGTIAGARGTHMEVGRAPECFRGIHWYDSTA